MSVGVVRNRTNLYLSYRQSVFRGHTSYRHAADGDGDDQHALLGEHSSHDAVAIEMDKLPPVWFDTPLQVNDILTRVAQQRTVLDKLCSKHLLPGFDDRSAEERQIQQLTANITQVYLLTSSTTN
jgi:syntaxin 16